MITTYQAVGWLGMRVSDEGGNPVGKLEGVYVDRRGNKPVWFVVATGAFGSRSVLVPARGSIAANGMVMLAVSRGAVRTAPRQTLAMAPLAAAEDRALARHYRHLVRLRQICGAPDHVTTAHPITDSRAFSPRRRDRFSVATPQT